MGAVLVQHRPHVRGAEGHREERPQAVEGDVSLEGAAQQQREGGGACHGQQGEAKGGGQHLAQRGGVQRVLAGTEHGAPKQRRARQSVGAAEQQLRHRPADQPEGEEGAQLGGQQRQGCEAGCAGHDRDAGAGEAEERAAREDGTQEVERHHPERREGHVLVVGVWGAARAQNKDGEEDDQQGEGPLLHEPHNGSAGGEAAAEVSLSAEEAPQRGAQRSDR